MVVHELGVSEMYIALESVEDIFSGTLNIWMDAVRSFGSLKLSVV